MDVCKTWTLQERHKKKLCATEMRYLRKVEGVSRMERIRNDNIRGRLRQEDQCTGNYMLRKKTE